ncbi:aspartic proteinase cdr1 [Quercus suber]|uniref:Aspartic proteinase cdr1 n=1 Tax=Quercus suber TaxID=58331 RepID=A0AAW0KWW4_QUESU
MSTTYKSFSCTSSQCEFLAKISCSNDGTSCQYSTSYGDGSSFSKGDLSIDTLTLGSTTSHPMPLPIIWCGHDNVGNFDYKGSDIVGIGGGAVSLVSQLSSSIGGKFSYCLVPLTSGDKNTSKLNFGSNADPRFKTSGSTTSKMAC